jgi:hypothetical protein
MGEAEKSEGAGAPSPAAVLSVFTATTFLSAVLLFSVQPLFAKMVLPSLGGAPSVWAVALLFFQGALLTGYCYAHLLIARLPLERTGAVHLGLSLLAFASLPIAIPPGWGEPPTSEPYLWQLGLFTAAIGLPFVAVAANAPLLQAWFARSGHPHGQDPYFLYAASNVGSLLALLSFPFVLEPVFGVSSLSRLWTWGFVLLVALLGVCFFLVWKGRSTLGAAAPAPDKAGNGARAPAPRAPQWTDRLTWVGLALVPAGLLTAFTTHIATDVASAPLIWVVPLALYLLTFVIVFREKPLIPARYLLPLHLAAVTLALLQLSQTRQDTWYLMSAIGTLAFLTSGLVAHRTLYEARPSAAGLTEFYLWMSFGGALGGLFAALVAPKTFPEVYEYPLLLTLTMACRPGALGSDEGSGERRWFALIIAAGLVLIVALPVVGAYLGLGYGGWGVAAAICATFAIAIALFWSCPSRQLAAALSMCMAIIFLDSNVHRGASERSYFGVYRVLVSDDNQFHVLKHGTTLHGAQRVRDADGKEVVDFAPKTYYHPKSPMAQAVAVARANLPEGSGPGRFGIVGLGAGSLACLSKKGESWRFYEIDPVVLSIARSDKFTYLSNCQPETDAVIGDARLTLGKEKDASFDLLLIDAFSSDAVPMHLLTVESLSLYAAKLKPGGLGVLHISNRYLDLEAVLAATIPKVEGLKAFAVEDPRPDVSYDAIGSTIVVFSRDLELVHRFLTMRGGRTLNGENLRAWTDDASDVLGPILSRWKKRR